MGRPKFDFHTGADRVASSCAATTRRARSLMRIWRWAIVPSDRSSTNPSPRRLSPPNSVEIVAGVPFFAAASARRATSTLSRCRCRCKLSNSWPDQ